MRQKTCRGTGRHSSILVDPFFARGLAICYDEIGLPDRVPNQMQNQHVFLCGFFTHDFTCVCRSIKARDNLSSFVISMRTDQDRRISCAPFYTGFLIRKNAHPNVRAALLI